jgi:DNA-binding MarR family transcriptional regulator
MPDQNIIDTWERLVRYHRTTTKAMDRNLRATFGRSLDDYDVLHQISTYGGQIRMGDLAENLLIADSSCNRIVGRLVDGGFVERSHGESDGRVVLVDLTQAGKRLRRRMAAVHVRDIEGRFGASMTATEASDLDAILRRLLAERPASGSA